MSLLNIALQNCALERNVMEEKYEKIMKSINSMNHLRNASRRTEGLEEAFTDAMKH